MEASQSSRNACRAIDMYYKILTTKNNLIEPQIEKGEYEVLPLGTKIHEQVKKLFSGSLAIRVVTAGSTNACEQELVALGNAFYDIERFGVHFVASPRHADMLIVTGPVSRNMKEALIRTYEAMPQPALVVTLGDDAYHGGVFKGSYAVCDGAQGIIPVHYHIPGDPPTPFEIMNALLHILTDKGKKT